MSRAVPAPERPRAARGRRATGALGAAAAILLGGWAVGCTEDPITGPDGPGASAPTVEAILEAGEVPGWRDTTFLGFALPSDAGFAVLSTLPELRARILARFPVPDSARSPTDTAEIQSYVSGAVSVRVDTARSVIPSRPVTVQLYALAEDFEATEATWTERRPGEAWGSPGGDLGTLIGEGALEAGLDSVAIELPGADTLLPRWRDAAGQPGVALVLVDPDVRLRVTFVRLRFEAEIEPVEDPVVQTLQATPGTFIFDPPQPETDESLRVGGVPAARFYLTFQLPDTIGGVPLHGARVNRAELRFFPLAPPPGPFALERSVTGRPMELVGDPFELGRRTPIGPPAPGTLSLNPDSLATGRPLRIDVTPLVQEQTSFPPDTVAPIRIGVRAEPDGQTLGYWEFGSSEAPAGLAPVLRVVLTPPPGFGSP